MSVMDMVFRAVGIITTFYGCVLLFINLCLTVKKIYKNQGKIKCLCKHEYIENFRWTNKKYDDITLVCRKYGKKKEITIWKDRKREE